MAEQAHAGKQNKSLLKLIGKYYADLADLRVNTSCSKWAPAMPFTA